MIDNLTVAKGYEAALGAALGDDLEAPADPRAPMRWAGAVVDPSDPVLPQGIEPLGHHVTAPAELQRRLRQIGLIERAEAERYVPLLKPGQRLVSREGDLWRWDGFVREANALGGGIKVRATMPSTHPPSSAGNEGLCAAGPVFRFLHAN